MRISIFGLGYVGAVSAGCLAKDGHTVIGVDTVDEKVRLINSGQSPIVEENIGEIIAACVGAGRLKATQDYASAINESDISLICVGTPSQSNGSLDLRYVRRVCSQIGHALRSKKRYHVVGIRSTMLPGSTREVVLPILTESSNKVVGEHFGVCVNPEFLREGTAVSDFFSPPKTVIGSLDERAGKVLRQLYDGLDAPLITTSLETAEMIKYADNPWHALKVAYANEIGRLCKQLGVDAREVMDIFCMDKKLNISVRYLRPGFAFGGSCLPKDIRAITHKAQSVDVELPIMSAVLRSNSVHLNTGLKMIMSAGSKRVGILGLSFKQGTDDLRESPMVELVERLLGKGYDISIFDRNVNLAWLRGSNESYLFEHVPHIARLLKDDIAEVFGSSDVIVIGHSEYDPANFEAFLTKKHFFIDLVDIRGGGINRINYDGICW